MHFVSKQHNGKSNGKQLRSAIKEIEIVDGYATDKLLLDFVLIVVN